MSIRKIARYTKQRQVLSSMRFAEFMAYLDNINGEFL